MKTMKEVATELRSLKELANEQEAAIKKTKAQIYHLETKVLPEMLEAEGQDLSRVPGVGTVYLQNKVFASVKADDRDRFHEWLRETGQEELIKETVHPGTLTAWAKEQLENGKPLPEFVQAVFVTQATLRKS